VIITILLIHIDGMIIHLKLVYAEMIYVKCIDSIKNIQSLLKNKINCETDDNFENIKIDIYKSFINKEGNWDL